MTLLKSPVSLLLITKAMNEKCTTHMYLHSVNGSEKSQRNGSFSKKRRRKEMAHFQGQAPKHLIIEV